MYIPPGVRRSDRIALDASMVRVEGPALVRMPRVHRAQGRPLDLPQKRRLMVVDVRVVRRLRRRPRKVQVAPVGGGRGHRRTGGHYGAAGVGRSRG